MRLAEEAGPTLSQENKTHLERVRSNARQMGELIDGLLALSRIMRSELNRINVDLSSMAREVEQEIRERQPDRSIEIVIDGEMRASGDRVLLRDVYANLIGNAWKFTAKRQNPRIEIGKMQSESDETVFYVRDNGAGFDMKYAHELFSPFQRLHRQDQFPGTGVGLATVQRIVLKHGGRIWAESEPEAGATFFFTVS